MWWGLGIIRAKRGWNRGYICLAKIIAPKRVLDLIRRETLLIEAEVVSWENIIRGNGEQKELHFEDNSLNRDLTSHLVAEEVKSNGDLTDEERAVRW